VLISNQVTLARFEGRKSGKEKIPHYLLSKGRFVGKYGVVGVGGGKGNLLKTNSTDRHEGLAFVEPLTSVRIKKHAGGPGW